MTTREWNLVKEAIARTRHELGDRVPPGSQDAWRNNHNGEGVKLLEAEQIRDYVRAALNRDLGEMRRISSREKLGL